VGARRKRPKAGSGVFQRPQRRERLWEDTWGDPTEGPRMDERRKGKRGRVTPHTCRSVQGEEAHSGALGGEGNRKSPECRRMLGHIDILFKGNVKVPQMGGGKTVGTVPRVQHPGGESKKKRMGGRR